MMLFCGDNPRRLPDVWEPAFIRLHSPAPLY